MAHLSLRGTLASVGAASTMLGFYPLAYSANRCVDAKGHVTYQDASCDASAPGHPVDTSDAFSTRPARPVPSTPGATGGGTDPAYASAKGSWRGPAQMHLTVAGASLDQPGTTPMVIELKTDGQVVGFIGQGSCRLAGLTTQLVAPYMGRLDVTASGCADSRFNGRYQGQLGAIASAQEAKMTLSTFVMLPGNRLQFMTIEAVLKR